MIGVRVTSNTERPRPSETLLDHDLMSNTMFRRRTPYTVLASKCLDLRVLGKVRLGLVLDVMVHRKHTITPQKSGLLYTANWSTAPNLHLTGIIDLGTAHLVGQELLYSGRGIVMGHALVWP